MDNEPQIYRQLNDKLLESLPSLDILKHKCPSLRRTNLDVPVPKLRFPEGLAIK
jgi:hypothetical protein